MSSQSAENIQHPDRLVVDFTGDLSKVLQRSAQASGVTASERVREIVQKQLELEEDAYFLKLAEEREKTFTKENALSHEEVFGHVEEKDFDENELDIGE